MTKHEAYVSLARTALSHLPPGEESVLACMVVLHTNDIILDGSCEIADTQTSPGNGIKRLHAVTRRHAAEIVAEATEHDSDQQVIDHWYGKYSAKTPYEVMEGIPHPLLDQVLAAMAAMSQSALVQEIAEAE